MNKEDWDIEAHLRRADVAPVSPSLEARMRPLLAAPRRARFPGRLALAAAALVAAVSLAVWAPWKSAPARVVAATGVASVAGRPAAPGDVVPPGALLHTGPRSELALELPDGSRVTLFAASEAVWLGPRAAGPVARLDSGLLACIVVPGAATFRVSTARGELAAVGTEFRASWDPTGFAGRSARLTHGGLPGASGPVLEVAVLAGRVEFREPDRVTVVGERQRMVVDAGGPPRVTGLTEGAGPEYVPSPGGTSLRSLARAVANIVLSPDGRRLAIGLVDLGGGGLGEHSADFVSVVVYDLATGQVSGKVPLDGIPSDLAWFADGTLWALESMNNDVRRVDLEKGTVADRRSLCLNENVLMSNQMSRLAASPDGKLAIVTGYDRRITVYEMPGWKRLRSLDSAGAPPTEGAWSPDGKAWLASDGEPSEVLRWEVATGELKRLGPGAAPVEAADGRVWAFTADRAAFGPLDPQQGEARDAFRPDGPKFARAALSPDGRFAALGRADGSVIVFDLAARAEFARFGHEGAKDRYNAVSCLTWAPDSSWLAVGRYDGSSELLRPEIPETK